MQDGPPQPQKDEPMADEPTMNQVLNKLHEAWAGDFDEKLMKDYFEMASDSDDMLALSGAVPMCLDMEDVPALRAFAAIYGSDAPAEFITALKGAPYEDDPTDSGDMVVHGEVLGPEIADSFLPEGEETDPEMRELLGLPPLPAGAMPAPVIVGAGPLKPISPATPARSTPHLPGTEPKAGQINRRVFEIMRKRIKVKDEDMAAMLGCARQTFINYADPKKKTAFVATAEQHAVIAKMIQDTLDDLNEALSLL
jgi:hypothetical protein